MVNLLTLPKVDLEIFTGDPKGYLPFIRQFTHSVLYKTDDKHTQLSILLKYVDGKAKGVLEGA